MGFTLLAIPFWWNRSPASLVATIRSQRPDLLVDAPSTTPISTTLPKAIQHKHFRHKPAVAKPYVSQMDPTGWYDLLFLYWLIIIRLMMEKFDGVRVFWDGMKLQSPFGSISVPSPLGFPKTPFEGELWYLTVYFPLNVYRMGINNYVQCINFLKNAERDWTNAKIIVFDAPQATDIPYSQRLNILHQGTYNLFPKNQKM
jgi:hypothetical protein